MISGFEIEAGEARHTLRLSTRAMMRIEDHFDKAIDAVFADLDRDPRISSVVNILAAVMDNGRGGTTDEAAEFVDEVGYEKLGEVLQQVAEKAFPQPTKGQAQGNAKRAPRRK